MPRTYCNLVAALLVLAAAAPSGATAQSVSTDNTVSGQVNMQLEMKPAASHGHTRRPPPAVVWLKPLDAAVRQALPEQRRSGYTLLQKNKTFSPHLLVVPVDSVVSFPNTDPFFHNVFSFFDGKRFDLGLYEAGSTREVRFSREGVSYIFCNIHPEMSAVVLSLDTPLWAQASQKGSFVLSHVPAGEYELHLWVEGESAKTLEHYVRRLHIASGTNNLGIVELSEENPFPNHTNEFGQPYITAAPVY